mmetsp:Transcript_22326/g.61920  ORF Transcript_22326/g.61920 Transcript_22326/m.61920 type:complete len:210 (+) Transcript_22326:489-1118(+)
MKKYPNLQPFRHLFVALTASACGPATNRHRGWTDGHNGPRRRRQRGQLQSCAQPVAAMRALPFLDTPLPKVAKPKALPIIGVDLGVGEEIHTLPLDVTHYQKPVGVLVSEVAERLRQLLPGCNASVVVRVLDVAPLHEWLQTCVRRPHEGTLQLNHADRKKGHLLLGTCPVELLGVALCDHLSHGLIEASPGGCLRRHVLEDFHHGRHA